MSEKRKDVQYTNIPFRLNEIEHKYGERIHLLADPYLTSLLAAVGRPEVAQPLLNHYFESLYTQLFSYASNYCFERTEVEWDTRMKSLTEHGVYRGQVIDPAQKAVVVDLARAGTYPSHLCYDALHYLLRPENVRQDHFYINRKVNEKNEVIGVDVSGSKIGGDQDDAYVFFPDPMGATGGSLSYCVDHYKQKVKGQAKRYIALHIIVTPEYIKRVTEDHPDVEVFAIRLDRGLSDPDVLQSVPGTFIDREKGLNDIHYIVPGAGGVGEILNNSYV